MVKMHRYIFLIGFLIFVFVCCLYFHLCLTAGTSAFSLSEGPDDVTRTYSDCKEADTAAICSSCAKVDEASTIMVVLTFIISIISMGWSIYEVFAEEREENSNSVQLLAILKKVMKVLFAIVALTSFKDCHDGMEKDDDIIEVKSYEYGVGAIALILVVILTVSAGILSVIVLYLKNKSDAKVGAAELEEQKHHQIKHTPAAEHKSQQQATGGFEQQFGEGLYHSGVELNCDHKRHAHGFNEKSNRSGAGHRSGNHSGQYP